MLIDAELLHDSIVPRCGTLPLAPRPERSTDSIIACSALLAYRQGDLQEAFLMCCKALEVIVCLVPVLNLRMLWKLLDVPRQLSIQAGNMCRMISRFFSLGCRVLRRRPSIM